ncbi:translation initiation factor [Rhynchospora pubera]|uniref:Translation initiation factor n=1 Tax=Rhynchospora pubera TaxID=906938 RepID=A0AAV8CNU2_9POAL|nr:translation initiation factor [Rhynchospora pubera]
MKEEAAEKQWSKEELEAEVKKAILARAPDFKAQASSLTFEGARRAIEQDLGMRQFSLDEHKGIVKRFLNECLSAKDSEKAPDPSENNVEIKNEGAFNFDDAEIKSGDSEVSEHMIQEAIKKRASFFKKNAETISLMKVRRLLEEDLNLVTKSLDAHKAFISTELEKVLNSPVVNKSENGGQKKPKTASQKVENAQTSKTSKRSREEPARSDDTREEEQNSDELEPKRRKKEVNKVKAKKASQNSSVKEKKKSTASSKGKKTGKKEREDNSVEEKEGGGYSDNNESLSSDEEDVKNKREKPTPSVYGKDVERLKSIIKSCGASIPPAVYRRAKQAPEDKREAVLIKELKDILEKEGLSTNPSEKEIKEVKRRKDRAKELEGIDMSNIITSSRRRSSAFSYIPPPKPPKLELSSSEDEDDDDEDDDDVVDMEKDAPNDDGNDDDSDENGDADKDGEDGDEGGEGDEGGNGSNRDNGDELEGSGKVIDRGGSTTGAAPPHAVEPLEPSFSPS